MTSEPAHTTSFDDLDALPTEELRERAFKLAWHHHDLGFFKTVIEHLPHAEDTEQLDGSLGSFGASLSDIVSLWREFTGHGYGDEEPLLRAAFIDYLMKN
ncbi:MAG TPA: hypothetical protein VGF84_13030 [Micromonosporaceae bacterium]|jgi:hypothetical protein